MTLKGLLDSIEKHFKAIEYDGKKFLIGSELSLVDFCVVAILYDINVFKEGNHWKFLWEIFKVYEKCFSSYLKLVGAEINYKPIEKEKCEMHTESSKGKLLTVSSQQKLHTESSQGKL